MRRSSQGWAQSWSASSSRRQAKSSERGPLCSPLAGKSRPSIAANWARISARIIKANFLTKCAHHCCRQPTGNYNYKPPPLFFSAASSLSWRSPVGRAVRFAPRARLWAPVFARAKPGEQLGRRGRSAIINLSRRHLWPGALIEPSRARKPRLCCWRRRRRRRRRRRLMGGARPGRNLWPRDGRAR